MNQYSGLEKLNADLTQKVLATKQETIDPQPGIPIVIEADITGKLLTWKASFKDTSQKQIKAWTNQFFNAMGIKASKVEVFPAAASRYKNDRNIARLLLIPTLPKTRGGKRAGSGMKPIHTNPDEKERSKKYRATNAEWERFKELTPTNSREAFLQILDLLEKNASD